MVKTLGPLKSWRLNLSPSKSQATIATELNTVQSVYQQWESGKTALPQAEYEKLRGMGYEGPREQGITKSPKGPDLQAAATLVDQEVMKGEAPLDTAKYWELVALAAKLLVSTDEGEVRRFLKLALEAAEKRASEGSSE